jgi:hypothetical protein
LLSQPGFVMGRKNKKSQPHIGWLFWWLDDDLQAKLLGKRRLALECDAHDSAKLLVPRVEVFDGRIAVGGGLRDCADGGLESFVHVGKSIFLCPNHERGWVACDAFSSAWLLSFLAVQ